MRPKFHLIVSALVLTSFTAAQATISLPTIVPVPIPAGTPITDGGGATLDNFVSQDLFVNTTGDWTTAAIVLELSAGSIYQDAFGFVNGPNSAFLDLPGFEALRFDTFVTSPSSAGSIDGTAGDLNNLVFQFDQSGLSASWDGGGLDKSNFGASNVGRFTLSDDAQGSWSLAVTEAFNPIVKFLSNPIVNGQMIVDPLQGDLNFDGFVGIQDLNTVLGVWNQNVTPGDRTAGDPSGDGFVGIEDMNIILGNFNAGLVPLVPGSSNTVERDLDGDGFVGIDDQNILLSNWNLNVPPADPRADPSGDGFVGIADKVTGNWGAGTPPMPIPGGSPPAVVPEPAGMAVFCMGLTFFAHRSRCRL